MLHKVKKNRHYATPFPWPEFYKIGQSYSYEMIVRFDYTVRYDIGDDQSDVNKLFGLSYGLHHTNSDRFGWRYNKEQDKVEIVAYCYNAGVRCKTHPLGFVDVGAETHLKLNVKFDGCIRHVTFETDLAPKVYSVDYGIEKKPCFGYTLGLYFGGNRRAPHTINCYINNEKFEKN